MIHVRNIRPEDWHVWRDLRLQALADSPDAFGETLNHAIQRSDSEWIASAATATQADRRLLLAEHKAQPVGMALIRVSPGDSTSADLFAMWFCRPGGAQASAAPWWTLLMHGRNRRELLRSSFASRKATPQPSASIDRQVSLTLVLVSLFGRALRFMRMSW